MRDFFKGIGLWGVMMAVAVSGCGMNKGENKVQTENPVQTESEASDSEEISEETPEENVQETPKQSEDPAAENEKEELTDYEIDYGDEEKETNDLELTGGINGTRDVSDASGKYITGTVRNNSDRTCEHVKIAFDLYDKEMNVIDTATDSKDQLEPGETWDFQAAILKADTFEYYRMTELTEN